MSQLLAGFREGFPLKFHDEFIPQEPENLPSARDLPHVVSQKLQEEVSQGRMSGGHPKLPFPAKVSPLGLVPKSTPGQFRLITHLSYPAETSVNHGFLPQDCSVKYESFDRAAEIVSQIGQGAWCAKTDVKDAFRIIPVHPSDFPLLVTKHLGQYYVDKCLPFGLSRSCQIFETFSSTLQWIIQKLCPFGLVCHYLDDFFFVAKTPELCQQMLQTFQELCANIGVPLSGDKTVGPTQNLQYLGLTIDTQAMTVTIPQDKIAKAQALIHPLTTVRKTKVAPLQSLVGLLNFMCRAIPSGRPFLRRLYDVIGSLPRYYHVSLSSPIHQDLLMWQSFLTANVGSTLIPNQRFWSSADLHLATDASATLGFGLVFGNHWAAAPWPQDFLATNPSIEFLELFPIVLAVVQFATHLANTKVRFSCDNQAVVAIINRQTSRSPQIMLLVRILVLTSLTYNILFRATFIPGLQNVLPDALSRLQITRFWQHAPATMDRHPTNLTSRLWPISEQKLTNYCQDLYLSLL